MNKKDRIIKKLSEEQYSDGSFGRFHSMNSKLKQKIPTTEAAAWLMYENSITRNNEICDKACLYMERLLNDLTQWPDNWEKNKWFRPAVPLFIASKLALFGSDDKKYKEIRNIWIGILESAFETTKYSVEVLNTKAKNLLGVEIDGSYIGLHSLNNLALYASNVNEISIGIQESYLKWLYNYDGVIAYTNTQLNNPSTSSGSTRIMSLLSKFEGFNAEF